MPSQKATPPLIKNGISAPIFLPISFIECFKFSILILLSFSINSLTDEDISPFLIITLSPILYFSVTTEDEVSSYL